MDINIEIELIKNINEKNKTDNFVISPIGIEILLSLCSNGAEGETQNEILKYLNFNNIEEANQKSKEILKQLEKNEDILKTANAILTKIRAKDKFIKIALDYDAKIEELKNYEHVNKWAKNKTKDKIVKIIDSLSPNVLMILLNALYLEAFWTIKFDQNNTYEKDFFNINEKKSIRTLTMFLRGELLNYYENDFLQAVKLNYKSNSGKINAIIILPKENINTFINDFNNEKYEKIIEKLKKDKINVNLFLPKFKIDYTIDMSEILKDLGIRKAFTKEAEFKEISDRIPLHIGQILQKNYINVNEEGTQAASLTELEVILECFRDKDPNAKDFIANKPFIFLLRNEDCPKGHDIIFFTKICKIENNNDNDY